MENAIKEALNPAQWEAVSYCEGPSLIIAGAGSGKTRVLTYKIAYLLQQGLSPWNILALTFTNKAAREMNERIAAIAGDEATRYLWSGTFHSIFSKILRYEAEYIGYTSDFTIYDAGDSRSLVKNIVKELQLDDKLYKPATVAARISEAKNALVLPDEYTSDRRIHDRDARDGIARTGEIYRIYHERCHKANVMDFDDLLMNTFLLLRDNPEVKEKYANRFQYILVDEYQDTNAAQHRIITLLTTPRSRICVVGDDAQSIYAFRGAKIDNILQFTEQYPGARVMKLERNYRSTQTIVNAANSIIRHNRNQIAKNVYSDNAIGSPIPVISSYSDKEESLKVLAEIRRLHRKENVGYDGIALLYRTNAQSRSFEETFRKADIPYRIYGGLSFYQRKEIKDLIAYFRVVCNPDDEEAFLRVLNYPARGIGDTTKSRLVYAAREHDVSLWTVASRQAEYAAALTKAAQTKVSAFCDMIASFRERLHEKSGYDLAIDILRETGMAAEVQSDHSPESISRQENIEELLGAIKAVENEMLEENGNEQVSLQEYVSQVSLLTDADKQDDDVPKVTLMTIHSAKGLEFDAVFVTGMEDELFPGSNARCYPKEMEEERRLFYVAVTRAKRFCYLTYAKSRYRYGKMEFCNPSIFLDEIDECYLQRDSKRYGQMNTSGPRPIPTGIFSPKEPERRQDGPVPSRFRRVVHAETQMPVRESRRTSVPETLEVGRKIEHERFGIGKVISIEGTGENAKACVEFEMAGRKNLLLKFARYKLI